MNIGRTTFTSGMSGMWSVMSWLFVTPFYWITGVWYRRMRHLTLGDWFVERYESRAMGAAYCVFGLLFFMVYGSMMFSAIGVVAAPLVGASSFVLRGQQYGIEYLLVPIIGLVVLVYGVAGGLRAAYFTDLIQGTCIILLSVLLIPFGLSTTGRAVRRPGDGWAAGRLPDHARAVAAESYFTIAGSSAPASFRCIASSPWSMISLVGVVVQPHFIATGGGSAKTETERPRGPGDGQFPQTILHGRLGADRPDRLGPVRRQPRTDPRSGEDLGRRLTRTAGPRLTGLMLACLLAALMSSADAYMIVGSAWWCATCTHRTSTRTLGTRIRVAGSYHRQPGHRRRGAISLSKMDVFEQLKLTWVFPVLFAAPFWIGMYWRRATTAAAWSTVAFCALMFFLIPYLAPRLLPDLR